jgi:hypothetical protein
MYDTVLILFAIGLCGFIPFMLRAASRAIVVMLLIYVGFASALIYYATQVFLQTGIPVIQGWYLSPMIPLEALAFVLGLQTITSGRIFIRASVFTGFCFLALTIYGHAFIAAPYYANLIEHAASGHLRAYHPRWGDVLLAGARLDALSSVDSRRFARLARRCIAAARPVAAVVVLENGGIFDLNRDIRADAWSNRRGYADYPLSTSGFSDGGRNHRRRRRSAPSVAAVGI